MTEKNKNLLKNMTPLVMGKEVDDIMKELVKMEEDIGNIINGNINWSFFNRDCYSFAIPFRISKTTTEIPVWMGWQSNLW